MEIIKEKNKIVIKNNIDFSVKDTLECGQVFSYVQTDVHTYQVVSLNKWATISVTENEIVITTSDVDYFYNYFDLNTNYQKIKQEVLSIQPDFSKYMLVGNGIRILKQDIYQTIISFIVSANNNIKRIKSILFKMSEKYGNKIEGTNLYSFPTLKQLSNVTEEDFYNLGAGYRSEYLVDTVCKLSLPEYNIELLNKMDTANLRKVLLTLKGVGPKVADCILFFGFSRTDVFPVDTWIRKAYYMFETTKLSDEKISQYFVSKFKNLSGYAQQYLFNYMITNKNNVN